MKNNGNRNAVGYVRTAVVDLTGETLKRQEESITAYCEQSVLSLVKIFTDNGASGLNFNRPGWNQLQDFVKQNKGNIQFLVVTDLARIGRDVHLALEQIMVLEQGLGLKVNSVKAPMDLNIMGHKNRHSPTDKLKPKRRI